MRFQQWVSSSQGRRRYQEDRATARENLAHWRLLASDEEKAAALARTFSQLQHEYGERPEVGTTVTCVVVERNQENPNQVNVTTAHVGDSPAFCYVIDRNGDVQEEVSLCVPHNPYNEDEKARVEREGGKLESNPGSVMKQLRLINEEGWFTVRGLSVTRSIGDAGFLGLSHEPDIAFYSSLSVPEGGRVVVVVASDGVTDNFLKGIGRALLNRSGKDPCDAVCDYVFDKIKRLRIKIDNAAKKEISEKIVGIFSRYRREEKNNNTLDWRLLSALSEVLDRLCLRWSVQTAVKEEADVAERVVQCITSLGKSSNGDNVTVVATEVPFFDQQAENQTALIEPPCLMVVADGHGGSSVSSDVVNHFHDALLKSSPNLKIIKQIRSLQAGDDELKLKAAIEKVEADFKNLLKETSFPENSHDLDDRVAFLVNVRRFEEIWRRSKKSYQGNNPERQKSMALIDQAIVAAYQRVTHDYVVPCIDDFRETIQEIEQSVEEDHDNRGRLSGVNRFFKIKITKSRLARRINETLAVWDCLCGGLGEAEKTQNGAWTPQSSQDQLQLL